MCLDVRMSWKQVVDAYENNFFSDSSYRITLIDVQKNIGARREHKLPFKSIFFPFIWITAFLYILIYKYIVYENIYMCVMY